MLVLVFLSPCSQLASLMILVCAIQWQSVLVFWVNAFWDAAQAEGMVLLELFGGICAGLEACLASGVKVCRYLYCDTSWSARTVAAARLQTFCAQYPQQLTIDAVAEAFTLPQDVSLLDASSLVRSTGRQHLQWLVVAGWECQDLSAAGRCQGLAGSRSKTFYDVVRIIGALQQLQVELPPAYLVENVAMQHNFSSEHIRQQAYSDVCRSLGDPVCIDAAAFGSRAHRLRNWWTNLADAVHLQLVCDQVQRPTGFLVNDILETGRYTQVARRTDKAPFYVCNVAGEALQALPTLVCYAGSRAFRDGAAGMIWDSSSSCLSEPSQLSLSAS